MYHRLSNKLIHKLRIKTKMGFSSSLRQYPVDKKLIQKQFEVEELFALVNTASKILIINHQEIIETLEDMCKDYERKGSRIHKIKKTHKVMNELTKNSRKISKKALLYKCMELLSPSMNKIVLDAYITLQKWKQRHANRRIIMYEP
jgi:hypothetical protein